MEFSCSYSDVRSMTTALAKEDLSTDHDCYKPYGLEMMKDDQLNYIHASIDNFDLNEDTIDGKIQPIPWLWWFLKKNMILQIQLMKFRKPRTEYSLKADEVET